MSNKEKRAKRTKAKAKKNRLMKAATKNERAAEKREHAKQYFNELITEQIEHQPYSVDDLVNGELLSPDEVKKLNTIKLSNSERFSSINPQYNHLYAVACELQEDALGLDAMDLDSEIYVIDEQGQYETFNQINNLVKVGKVKAENYQYLMNLYRDYLFVWCLSFNQKKPTSPIPYFDWWQCNKSYISVDDTGKEIIIKSNKALTDEHQITFDIAKHFAEDYELIAPSDEFIGYKYDHKNTIPWYDHALDAVEYLESHKASLIQRPH